MAARLFLFRVASDLGAALDSALRQMLYPALTAGGIALVGAVGLENATAVTSAVAADDVGLAAVVRGGRAVVTLFSADLAAILFSVVCTLRMHR
jgi:hypothetical protein